MIKDFFYKLNLYNMICPVFCVLCMNQVWEGILTRNAQNGIMNAATIKF